MTANVLKTTDKIADYALMKFSEQATFIRTINREYDSSFANKNAKIGDTLRVPIPQHGRYTKGRKLDTTPLQTITRNVTVFGQRHFGITMNSAEMALDIEEMGPRYLDQQIADFVVNLESEILTMAVQATPNQTGNPAARFDKVAWANYAKMQIENNGGHKGTKRLLLNPAGEIQVIDSLKGLFNAQRQINVQYEEGEMGRASGFDWAQTTVMPVQSRGTGNGSYLVNGANQTGDSIVVDTGTGTILKGEIITFAGAVAVHPQTKQNLGYLQQFVVTEDYAGGGGSIKVYPAIVTTGTEKNVTGSPTENGAVTIAGTASTPYGINLAYTKDAFTFGTVDLPDLPGYETSRRVYDGISMRVTKGADIVNDEVYLRFDIMAAFGALRPEWASRIANDHTALTPA
jgi:hypothetical protein